ncbi:fungal-specific transcription factor domain-containing protein [Dactylonectria estremocensis]|uniref:Fungal-specific transcription factor domain-containing protein n=1 Tax=Dactylonectria estremocensis TaxID=1079267 RepID=A0A9P9JB04_9HYPO|nr:fungal-specific transcription factor domain-containing protein [Dactylonectria estremocensis]
MLLYARLAQPKAPKTRSRAGCTSCKNKKRKCDESRPQCGRCRVHDVDCVYGPIQPRKQHVFKSKVTQSSDARVNSLMSSTRPPVNVVNHSPDASVSTTSLQDNNSSEIAEANDSDGRNNESFEEMEVEILVSDDGGSARRQDSQQDVIDAGQGGKSPTASAMTSPQDNSSQEITVVNDSEGHGDEVFADMEDEILINDESSSARRPDSPQDVIDEDGNGNAHTAAAAPDTTAMSLEVRTIRSSFENFSPHRTRQKLLAHFCNVVSRLIVLEDRCENPFTRLVLPLCQYSQLVRNAVYALASAHLEFHGVQSDEKAAFYYSKSAGNLESRVTLNSPTTKNELLAAFVILTYYEVLFQNGRSAIINKYLKGIMNTLRADVANDATTLFLEEAFRYYDVISALSFGTAPLSNAPSLRHLSKSLVSHPGGSASHQRYFDTLLGRSTSLWPIMHRLSSLGSLKKQLDISEPCGGSKAAVLRAEFELSASAIETALVRWQPESSIVETLDESQSEETTEAQARMQSLLSNSLAYRHSALVYLYRRVRCLPRNHKLVQLHAHLSLKHCVEVANSVGPMGALLWPLFIAACEATSLEDRDMAMLSFSSAQKRQGMMNIDKAWTLVREVWIRQDEVDLLELDEADTLSDLTNVEEVWRTVSMEMNIGLILG